MKPRQHYKIKRLLYNWLRGLHTVTF